MIPILYDANETEYRTNGIGRLSDAITCKVTEERNGSYELEMTYPIDGNHYEDIEALRIIAAIPADGKPVQPFIIYEISKPLNGIVTVRAEHISYRLKSIPVTPYSASSLASALSGLKSHSVIANPFSFSTDISSSAVFSVDVPSAVRSLLAGQDGSILDVYGGEWEFDRFTCKLWKSRGSDNGVRIAYGKNLTDLKQEEKVSDTYTGIMPYWKTEKDDVVTIVYSSPRILYADNHTKFPYEKIEVVDLSSTLKAPDDSTSYDGDDDTGSTSKSDWQPTQAEVADAGRDYITDNQVGVPDVSLDVSFVSLADTEEYRDLQGEQISLCDSVTVEFPKLGVRSTAQVIKTEYDVLTERYEKLELGNEKQTLSGSIQDYINSVRSDLDRRISETASKSSGGSTTDPADQRAVNNVIALIGAAKSSQSESDITAARTAYDKLTDTQKKLVTNYSDLTDAEQALADRKAAEQAAKDKAAADNVINLINTAKSSGSESDVTAARSAYDALTETQKGMVTNYSDLTALESSLNEQKKEDAEAAQNVIDLIEKASQTSTIIGVSSARTAYNGLTESQKKLVTNYDVLVELENSQLKKTQLESSMFTLISDLSNTGNVRYTVTGFPASTSDTDYTYDWQWLNGDQWLSSTKYGHDTKSCEFSLYGNIRRRIVITAKDSNAYYTGSVAVQP